MRDHSHAAVKVHAVDTNRRVIFDAQIDVLANAKSEIACFAEVLLPQFVFLNFQASLEDLFCLRASDCNMHGDLLVTSDTECPDGVAGLAVYRCLSR